MMKLLTGFFIFLSLSAYSETVVKCIRGNEKFVVTINDMGSLKYTSPTKNFHFENLALSASSLKLTPYTRFLDFNDEAGNTLFVIHENDLDAYNTYVLTGHPYIDGVSQGDFSCLVN